MIRQTEYIGDNKLQHVFEEKRLDVINWRPPVDMNYICTRVAHIVIQWVNQYIFPGCGVQEKIVIEIKLGSSSVLLVMVLQAIQVIHAVLLVFCNLRNSRNESN